MSEPRALVVLGVLAADPTLLRAAGERFAASHGGVARWGEPAPFRHTRYYEPELGPDLSRAFLVCARPRPAEALLELKREAVALERELADPDGRRRVNLDPGTVDATRFLLLSGKAGPYKLYLGQGTWADLLLVFRDGAWQPLPWTFPDLRQGPHLELLRLARALAPRLAAP